MGLCSSAMHTDEFSQDIDQKLLADHQKNKSNKILLLGPGESGKSTFLKQLIELYADDKNSDRPEDFKSVINGNVIEAIQTLIRKRSEFAEKEPLVEDYKITQTQEMRNCISHLKTLNGEEDLETSDITADIARQIQTVWNDPAIQNTYLQRASFQLHDSAEYFMNKISAVGRENYVPSVDDIIRARLRTLGVNEVTFRVGDERFTIVDVGGQRSERNKWIHCFEDAAVLIFFAAASEYDQMLYEDETANRMDEALGLFQQVATSRWFKSTKVVLFLNKVDLLETKLKTKPLSSHFTDFPANLEHKSADVHTALEFLKDKFEGQTEKKVSTHFTCVINGESIQQLFQHVITVVLRRQLAQRQLI